MIHGNWVPIHKGFAKFLPLDRPYGEHEAMLSVSIDYDNDKSVSVTGYATQWKWSRTKVNAFFERYGIEIEYKNDTKILQKQKGQIKKQKKDRKETEKGQIRFIDSKVSQDLKDRKKAEEEQKKSRSKDTTIDPILDPDPDPDLNTKVEFVVQYLNKKASTNYKSTTKKTISLIKARIKEGYVGKDFMAVIDKKTAEWIGTEHEKYLRPETLFGNKFEGYLNQKINPKKPQTIEEHNERFWKEFEQKGADYQADFGDSLLNLSHEDGE